MLCQLQGLKESVVELSFFEMLPRRILKKIFYSFDRIKRFIGIKSVDISLCYNSQKTFTTYKKEQHTRIFPLKLKAGEEVMVKSAEEIKKTLDHNNKFQGLAYTPVMWKYCCGKYTVLKRMEKVFDERKWKLSKVKNMVLLDGVICDGAGGLEKEWDGCDRSCFIWWKEGWLERVDE